MMVLIDRIVVKLYCLLFTRKHIDPIDHIPKCKRTYSQALRGFLTCGPDSTAAWRSNILMRTQDPKHVISFLEYALVESPAVESNTYAYYMAVDRGFEHLKGTDPFRGIPPTTVNLFWLGDLDKSLRLAKLCQEALGLLNGKNEVEREFRYTKLDFIVSRAIFTEIPDRASAARSLELYASTLEHLPDTRCLLMRWAEQQLIY